MASSTFPMSTFPVSESYVGLVAAALAAQRGSVSVPVEASLSGAGCASGKMPGLGWVRRGRKNELGDSSSVCRPGLPQRPGCPLPLLGTPPPVPAFCLACYAVVPGPPRRGEAAPCSVATSAFSPFLDCGSVRNLAVWGRGMGSSLGFRRWDGGVYSPPLGGPLSNPDIVQLAFLSSVLPQTCPPGPHGPGESQRETEAH